MRRSRRSRRWVGFGWVAAASVVATGCLEPNPNAVGETQASGTSDTSTSDTSTSDTSTGDSSETGSGAICDPCGFAFESLAFEVGATETISIPKPDRPHTVPFATITNYAPANNANSLGYAMAWTDAGDTYELKLTLTGNTGNTKVGGVAVVLGFSDELGAPEVQEVQVAADGCEAVSLDGLGDRVYLDAVERYEPGSATVLNYARTASAGASLEYCVTQADAPEASLTYKVVMFSVPEGVVSLDVPEVDLDSGAPVSADYGDLGADLGAAQLIHLIGARSFDEASEPSLGYQIACSAQSPFGCTYELLRFKAGARVVAGGSIIAIQ